MHVSNAAAEGARKLVPLGQVKPSAEIRAEHAPERKGAKPITFDSAL